MALTRASAAVIKTEEIVNNRNRIINGDMRIAQRGTSATGITTSGYYTVDRFRQGGTGTVLTTITPSNEQATNAPDGFINSFKYTNTNAASPLTGTQIIEIDQLIEGTNIADLAWGTANAKTVTLSFWVRSSLTGTFGASIQNSAQDRAYPITYTISVADTWEYKTVTIPGDTTGTWLTTTGIGLRVYFTLGAGPDRRGTAGAWAASDFRGATGQVELVETAGATFYITGVQLEVGSVATPFERRPYGTELSLCQRYCVVWGPNAVTHLGTGSAYNTTAMNITVPVPVPMRTTPTPSKTTTGGNWLNVYVGASGQDSNSTPEVGEAGIGAYRIYTPSSGTGFTVGQASWCQVLNGASFILSAEL